MRKILIGLGLLFLLFPTSTYAQADKCIIETTVTRNSDNSYHVDVGITNVDLDPSISYVAYLGTGGGPFPQPRLVRTFGGTGKSIVFSFDNPASNSGEHDLVVYQSSSTNAVCRETINFPSTLAPNNPPVNTSSQAGATNPLCAA